MCAEWYYGERCELSSACTRSNCQHGGTCVNVSSDEFLCVCSDKYFGDSCQFFNACRSSPCLNGGRCSVEPGNRYSCRCRPGYRGVDCSLYDPCASSPCLHGGRCTALSDATFRSACFNTFRVLPQTFVLSILRYFVALRKLLFCQGGYAFVSVCLFFTVWPKLVIRTVTKFLCFLETCTCFGVKNTKFGKFNCCTGNC